MSLFRCAMTHMYTGCQVYLLYIQVIVTGKRKQSVMSISVVCVCVLHVLNELMEPHMCTSVEWIVSPAVSHHLQLHMKFPHYFNMT